MKTATVADLRNNFATVSKWIHAGAEVTITKRGLPFATLTPSPLRPSPPAIDRMARLHRLFPAGPAKGDVQNVINYDRGNT